MYTKAAIAGHPIHPVLVGFPVASYVGTLVAFAVYSANGHQFWLNLAIALNVIGVGSAILAALPGFIDAAFGVPRRSAAKRTAIAHGLTNVCVLGLFLAILPYYTTHWNGPAADATLGLVLSSIGVLLTLMAGLAGWRLVQTFHVGIHMTPNQERDEFAVQSENHPLHPLHLLHRRSA